MHAIREASRESRRLDSWKEIAAFFGRDERTVKRWEKEKGLPVHRLPENTGARVFAFTDELTRWMKGPSPTGPKPVLEQRLAPAQPAASNPHDALVPASARPSRVSPFWIAAAVFVSMGLLIAYYFNSSRRSRLQAATHSAVAGLGTPSSSQRSSTMGTDAVTRELYLTGRYHWDKRTPDDLNKAVDYFSQAIARDPNYAPAYVGLANCYSLMREFAAMPSNEAFPRALAAAKKATELDGSSAEAHNALALVTFYWNWDVDGAEREFRRAITLDPNYVTAHHWYATFLMVLGRYSEALQQIDRARQLDPASTPILADRALILFHQGDRDQAISLLHQLAASQPDFYSTHRYLSHLFLDNGDYQNYLEEAGKAAALSRNADEMAIVRAAENGYRSGGRMEMLQSILRLQKKYFEAGRMPAYYIAKTYGRMGNSDEALRYLKISFQRHEVDFLAIRVDEALTGLHDNASFKQLVEEAGLASLP